MEDRDEVDLSLVEIAAGAAKWLKKLPLGPAKEQIGELIGDSVRLRRLKNLERIMGEVDRFAETRGLRADQVRVLSLHVGLPWIDKASLCEDGGHPEAVGRAVSLPWERSPTRNTAPAQPMCAYSLNSTRGTVPSSITWSRKVV